VKIDIGLFDNFRVFLSGLCCDDLDGVSWKLAETESGWKLFQLNTGLRILLLGQVKQILRVLSLR
jgi:hypothetical protein